MAKAKAKAAQYVIAATEGYGLFCGVLVSFDTTLGVAVLRDCRQIAHWRGDRGGITSLAATGICGPTAGESRIGRAAPAATLRKIQNIYICTAAARSSLEVAGG